MRRVSQYNIKKKSIEEIVSQEDPRNPLADDQIRKFYLKAELISQGVLWLKYRSQLGVPGQTGGRGCDAPF